MKTKLYFYSNLHKSLKTLIQFFNLGADELPEALEKIENLLMLQGLESSELVHQYYEDRLKEQMNISCEPSVDSGMLTVKAHFYKDMLNLEILNARNLKSLYKKGNAKLLSFFVWMLKYSLILFLFRKVRFICTDKHFSTKRIYQHRKVQNERS